MYQTVIFLALCMKLKIISFEGFKSGISNLSSFQLYYRPDEMFSKQLAAPSAALFLREVKSIIIMMISGGNFVPMGSH